MEHFVRSSLVSEKVVNGTDSRVCLGAIAKGRSSSRQLNTVLRMMLGSMIAGNKYFVQFYIPSKQNPSDDPTRDVELPAPKPVDPDYVRETVDR